MQNTNSLQAGISKGPLFCTKGIMRADTDMLALISPATPGSIFIALLSAVESEKQTQTNYAVM